MRAGVRHNGTHYTRQGMTTQEHTLRIDFKVVSLTVDDPGEGKERGVTPPPTPALPLATFHPALVVTDVNPVDAGAPATNPTGDPAPTAALAHP